MKYKIIGSYLSKVGLEWMRCVCRTANQVDVRRTGLHDSLSCSYSRNIKVSSGHEKSGLQERSRRRCDVLWK